MTTGNRLQSLRKSLGLTIDELSDREDVQSSTIVALEHNNGVFGEKARAMRMLIRLGVPYKINERGSVLIDNHRPIMKPNGGLSDMSYLKQYFDDTYLGNGLSQSTDGSIFYNEFRDALSQSPLEVEELSERYEIPVDKLIDLSCGRRFSNYHPETIDMLDDLNIVYSYNDDDTLYVRRHFRVNDDSALADMMANSFYAKRNPNIFSESGDDIEDLEFDLDIDVSDEDSSIVEEDVVMPDSIDDLTENIEHDPLDTLSESLKNVLASFEWDDEDLHTLKDAYRVVGMRKLEEELSII